MKIEKCLLCQSPVKRVLKLVDTPPANSFPERNQTQEVYPLNLMQCKNQECEHLQIDYEVDKETLFKKYTYVSDTGESNRKYFKQYAEEMETKFKPEFVVDVGSNDGLFLSYFKCDKLGVDPAENIVDIAKVPTICEYFNALVGAMIRTKLEKLNKRVDLITCNNMFAHNADLSQILRGASLLLKKGGTFVIEVSYGLRMVENHLFDLVYHEHIHHWHLKSLSNYVMKHGFKIYDAEEVKTHGGSIRVYLQHIDDVKSPTERLTDLKFEEELYFNDFVKKLQNKVTQIRRDTNKILNSVKDKKVAILGYPAKACTLSYYFDLQNIMCVFDDNPLKIGLTSHRGLQILSTSKIKELKPDYLLILAWNYAEQLMAQHPEYAGKFIIPLPNPRMV